RYESCPDHGRRYYRCRGKDRLASGPRCGSPVISGRGARGGGGGGGGGPCGAHDVELRSRVEVLARKLRGAEVKVRKLLDLHLEDGLPKDEIADRLRTITRERDGLRGELERAQANMAERNAAGGRLAALDQWAAKARRGIDRLDTG